MTDMIHLAVIEGLLTCYDLSLKIKIADSIYFSFFLIFIFILISIYFSYFRLSIGGQHDITCDCHITIYQMKGYKRFQNNDIIVCLLYIDFINNICSLKQARFGVTKTISLVYIRQILYTWNSIQDFFLTLALEFKL